MNKHLLPQTRHSEHRYERQNVEDSSCLQETDHLMEKVRNKHLPAMMLTLVEVNAGH